MPSSSTINVRRRLSAVVFAFALVAALTVVASPASACTTTLRAPYKGTSQLVYTRVSNGNCQSNLQSTLQRHRWYGWQVVAYKYVPQNSSAIISWNCSGVGTYTYQAGYGNTWHWHAGPKARLSC
jgi:hypothetical protein